MKLYRTPDLPARWVGEDQDGALVHWPAEDGGWQRRTPYTGPRRSLEEVAPPLARGSGWPGAGRGRAPRSASGIPSKTIGLRVTEEERAQWQRAADIRERNVTAWARDELNAAAERTIAEVAKPRGKTRP